MLLKKKYLLLVVLTVVFNMCVTSVYAFEGGMLNTKMAFASGIGIQPFWVDALSASTDMSVSGRNLSITAFVTSRSTSTKISGTLYVEKNVSGSWVPAYSWGVSSTGSLYVTKSYTADSAGTYRSHLVVTAGSDNINCTSTSYTVK